MNGRNHIIYRKTDTILVYKKLSRSQEYYADLSFALTAVQQVYGKDYILGDCVFDKSVCCMYKIIRK